MLPPKLAIANLVGSLRENPPIIFDRNFGRKSRINYGRTVFGRPAIASSCGGTVELVKQYVADQRRPLEKRQIMQSERFTGRKRSKTKEWLARPSPKEEGLREHFVQLLT